MPHSFKQIAIFLKVYECEPASSMPANAVLQMSSQLETEMLGQHCCFGYDQALQHGIHFIRNSCAVWSTCSEWHNSLAFLFIFRYRDIVFQFVPGATQILYKAARLCRRMTQQCQSTHTRKLQTHVK